MKESIPGTPRHGFQGDRGRVIKPDPIPANLTIAISREVGARGGTIGRRLAEKLGWAVYNQELLEFMANDEATLQGLLDSLSPQGQAWVESQVKGYLQQNSISSNPDFLKIVRLVLAIAVEGKAVLIGRGAGQILPPATTLYARIVANPDDRVAFLSQSMRLSKDEAAEVVRVRDQQRTDFIRKHFQVRPEDTHQYDLILNSSLLGEVLSVDILVQAANSIAKIGLPRRPVTAN